MRTWRHMMVLACAAGCAAGLTPTIAPEKTTAVEMQPLETGWTWTYVLEGGARCRRAVVGRENVGRFDCRIIEEQTGEAVNRYWLRSDRDGLKLFRTSDGLLTHDFDDPAIWFRYPARRTTRWSYEMRLGSVEIQCEAAYEDDERIRVPAGEFTCARIRTRGLCGRTLVFDKVEWYAKGIGLARQEVKYHDGRQGTMSLKEISR